MKNWELGIEDMKKITDILKNLVEQFQNAFIEMNSDEVIDFYLDEMIYSKYN